MMWSMLQKLIIEDSIDFNTYDKYINTLNIPAPNGNYCLHYAVISDNADKIVPYLLNQGANINNKNNYGETCLHWACKSGNLDIIKLLINSGANIFALDKDDKSILRCCVKYNNQNKIKRKQEQGSLVK